MCLTSGRKATQKYFSNSAGKGCTLLEWGTVFFCVYIKFRHKKSPDIKSRLS